MDRERYKPKALSAEIEWGNIIGIGVNHENETGWMPTELEPRFEMDLYDVAGVTRIVEKCIEDDNSTEWIARLKFLASISASVCHF